MHFLDTLFFVGALHKTSRPEIIFEDPIVPLLGPRANMRRGASWGKPWLNPTGHKGFLKMSINLRDC